MTPPFSPTTIAQVLDSLQESAGTSHNLPLNTLQVTSPALRAVLRWPVLLVLLQINDIIQGTESGGGGSPSAGRVSEVKLILLLHLL